MQGASTEKREPHEVVARVRPGWIVEVAAAEEGLVVKEVNRDVTARQTRFEHSGPRLAAPERDAQWGRVAKHPFGGDGVVPRDDDARIVPERGEGRRQSADDVAQPTGFDEMAAFGGDEENRRGRGHRTHQLSTKLSTAATMTPTTLSPAISPEATGITIRPASGGLSVSKALVKRAPSTKASDV